MGRAVETYFFLFVFLIKVGIVVSICLIVEALCPETGVWVKISKLLEFSLMIFGEFLMSCSIKRFLSVGGQIIAEFLIFRRVWFLSRWRFFEGIISGWKTRQFQFLFIFRMICFLLYLVDNFIGLILIISLNPYIVFLKKPNHRPQHHYLSLISLLLLPKPLYLFLLHFVFMFSIFCLLKQNMILLGYLAISDGPVLRRDRPFRGDRFLIFDFFGYFVFRCLGHQRWN